MLCCEHRLHCRHGALLPAKWNSYRKTITNSGPCDFSLMVLNLLVANGIKLRVGYQIVEILKTLT